MISRILFISLLSPIIFLSCKTQIEDNMETKISVHWEVVEQNFSPDSYLASFKIVNGTKTTLKNDSWELHFNQIVAQDIQNDILSIKRVSGDYFILKPKSSLKKIQPGDSAILTYEMPGQFNRSSFRPLGLFLVIDKREAIDIDNYTYAFFPKGIPDKWSNDKSFITAEKLYDRYNNRVKTPEDISSDFDILPVPLKIEKTEKILHLDTVKISYPNELNNEAIKLGSLLSLLYKGSIALTDKNQGNIQLNISKNITKEGYKLNIDSDKITIDGGSNAGVYYGIQSLIQIINQYSSKKESSILVKQGTWEDSPRFPYRGLMIDVARNFQSKETIIKMIELMGYFKLNKLHFHLANDEGWRLEITQIPELTSIGAFRGFTKDERDNLFPAYGSGPDPHSIKSNGNGFYTREDFIEILLHAKKNHIEVIPEIVMPGHSRAAIKAMEARYFSLKDESKKDAEKYLLTDFNDTSEYLSVQNYYDNVVCVGRESVYTFLETVINEIVDIYKEAEAPLSIIHTGGDEVPEGVWEGSPICIKKAEEKGLKANKSDLGKYFLKRLNDIISKHNLVTGGWEEIALKRIGNEESPDINFLDSRFLPYVWHNEHAYTLPNSGYKVVFCNAPSLYFDLAYENDIYEPGLSWAGFVGADEPYLFQPFNLKVSQKLKNPENILGIQGALWSETIKGPDWLGYFALPKLITLSHRAWSKDESTSEASLLELKESIYLNHLKKIHLINENMNFKVPKPGIIVKSDTVYLNSAYRDISIRFTLDGSTPDENSEPYEKGIPAIKGSIITAKSFLYGKKSVNSTLILK